ncbi:MAG: hypothetical protein ACJA01_004139 [Saprospiraceae bacterium]|jgi:hypothetical protein
MQNSQIEFEKDKRGRAAFTCHGIIYSGHNELSKDKHLLEMRVTEEKEERSKGKACRIRYFYINRNL